MLDAYLAQFQNLIQAPTSPVPLISTAQATDYINTARKQVATDGECVRVPGTLPLVANVQSYAISNIAVPTDTFQAFTVRQGWVGTVFLDIRSWEWFGLYYLNSGATGTPARMAQQGQGDQATLYFSPIPNAAGSVLFDCVALPIDLVDDTTPEAVPNEWSDAVTFYAAWLGMQSLQRQSDAEMMMARYQLVMRRARRQDTPSVLPGNLPGDLGAKLAASKTSLTEAPQPGRGG